jgi:N-acetylglucosamine-6-sulfatase
MEITRRTLLRGAGAMAGTAAITATFGTRMDQRRAWAVDPNPTIVVIVTDDMRFDFRSVVTNLDSQWIDCVNAAIETPLCGPARASLLTGKYSYRLGVTSNTTTYKMPDTDTIATRIKGAGYRTVLSGKYLNGYPWDRGRSYVPPGWVVWNAAGSLTWKPGTQHTTDYVFGFAINQIRTTPNTTPLFVYIAPQAPHLPAKPPARYANATVNLPPIPPSFNEADVSDKPPPDNSASLLTATQIAQVDTDRVQIGRSLLGVNDGIANLLTALSDTGRLANSVIVFTSDNGYMLGEHRLFKKGEPYEEPSHIPFMVRWPDVAGRSEPGVISSVDLSATVCVLAGAAKPSADGVDLSPLLSAGTPVRDAAYIEAAGSRFDALRTGRHKYAEYKNGAGALYDLATDPFELVNVASNPAYATTRSALANRLATLRR